MVTCHRIYGPVQAEYSSFVMWRNKKYQNIILVCKSHNHGQIDH